MERMMGDDWMFLSLYIVCQKHTVNCIYAFLLNIVLHAFILIVMPFVVPVKNKVLTYIVKAI